MARLAVLQPDPRTAARLSAALAGVHTLVECRSTEEFWRVVEGDSVDGCVVDIYDRGFGLNLAELRRLRRRVPPLAIIVYADFADRERDLFELGRLKIDGVIWTGMTDQPAETRRAVSEALSTAAALCLTGTLQGKLDPLGIDCLRWALEHATDSPTVEQLAEALALTPSALARELRRRQLPTPARLILWGRLFRAARMLAIPDRTVEYAAFRLGYSSGSALTRAFRRETGLTPSEMRPLGPLSCTVEGFLRREVRPPDRSSR